MKNSILLVAASAVLVTACGGGSSGGGDGGGDPADARRNDGGGDLPDSTPLNCEGVTPVEGTPNVRLEALPGSYVEPLLALSPPDDPRVFVVERGGLIKIAGGGTFLTVTDVTESPEVLGEQGLLGLAFHPGYASNRKFYVFWTAKGPNDNRVHVDEYTAMSGNPDQADAGSKRPILDIAHEYDNHNGGMLAFGPDGFLYVAVGDGGYRCDPDENAQNPDVLNGKILRVDVNSSGGGNNYVIPAGNPHGNEVYHLGLRNPWRFSFDRGTGDMYIGDVGQNNWEEIDVAPAGAAGLDFGWDTYEADLCHAEGPTRCTEEGDVTYRGECDDSGITMPVVQHNDSPSIIGGHVYRGCRMPGYRGRYFYGELDAAWVRSFVLSGGAATSMMEHDGARVNGMLAGIGTDANGELLFCDIESGSVLRMVPE